MQKKEAVFKKAASFGKKLPLNFYRARVISGDNGVTGER